MAAQAFAMKLLPVECHGSSLIESQYWLGAVRQQAITRANVDQDLCRHMASLGLNVFTQWPLVDLNEILDEQF